MAVDLFSLLMRIQTSGLAEAQAGLRGLDTQGRTTAAGLGGVASTMNKAELAANAKAAATGALAARFGALGGVVSAFGPVGLAVGGTLALVGGIMRTTAPEADALRISTLRLEGAARLTGVSLGFLERVSRQTQAQFKLSAMQSNELTAEVSKLTGKAGDLSQTSAVLAAFLNVGAAQGMTAEQTLIAVHQAILGIDEGTDKLFQKNPSVIYAEFARQIGTTAGKLNDQQKAQAMVAEALRASLLVGDAYNRFLDTAVGKQAQLATASERFQAALGRVFEPLRGWLADVGANFFNWLGDIIERMQRLTDGFEGMGRAGNVFFVPRMLDRFIRAAMGMGDDPFAEVESGSSTTGVRAPAPAPPKPLSKSERERIRKAYNERVLGLANMDETMSPADSLNFQGFPSTIATRDDRIDVSDALVGRGVSGGNDAVDDWERMVRQQARSLNRDFANLGGNLGVTLANGFGAGLAAAISGKNPFKAFGNVVLAGLGAVFSQMGSAMITAGVALLKLLPFLSNPLTGGPALIAAGVLLTALGATLGGIATGPGGGGGGSGASRDRVTEITLTADGLGGRNAPHRNDDKFTVLGVNTPQGQRVLATASKGAKRRNI